MDVDLDYFEQLSPWAPPEHALLLAILVRALTDLATPRYRSDARKWIFNNKRNDFFSFLGVCSELKLKPNHVRWVGKKLMSIGSDLEGCRSYFDKLLMEIQNGNRKA